MHGKKSLKTAQLIQKYAPWFSLSKYEGVKNLGAIGWAWQIAVRVDLQALSPATLLRGRMIATSSLQASFYELLALLYEKPLINEKEISKILTSNHPSLPGSFASLAKLNRYGHGVHPLTVLDCIRIGKDLREDSQERIDAAMESRSQNRSSMELTGDPGWHERETEEVLHEPVKLHLTSQHVPNQTVFLTVNLSLPPELLIRQFKEVIYQQQEDCLYKPANPKQDKKPALPKWEKSKVLPYIDLLFWRSRLEDVSLRKSFNDAVMAHLLEMDDPGLLRTTKTHRDELLDPLGPVFAGLIEAAISEMRGPVPLTRQSRKKRH